MDRWTKSAHFIPMRINYTLQKLVELYIDEIVKLRDIPLSIVSDRDLRFTLRFWESFKIVFGTKLELCSAYHLQTIVKHRGLSSFWRIC